VTIYAPVKLMYIWPIQ